MSLPEASLIITILIFVGGLVFQAGKLSTRVEALEEWEREARTDVKALLATAARIEATLKRATD